MVKNISGGTGTKHLARKHQTNNHNSILRLPNDPLEVFACVTKMLGNGMCEVFTNDNIRLIAHIRNSFRGKNKRHNLITLNSIVLVGLHEWEKIPKNCNIMVLYDSNQVELLKNMPNIYIDHLLRLQLDAVNFLKNNKHDDFEFASHDNIYQPILVNNLSDTHDFNIPMFHVNLDDI
jgi:initiation factor 1A